jgi:hypothetical protein
VFARVVSVDLWLAALTKKGEFLGGRKGSMCMSMAIPITITKSMSMLAIQTVMKPQVSSRPVIQIVFVTSSSLKQINFPQHGQPPNFKA